MSFSPCNANTGENDAKTDFISDFHRNFEVIDLLGKGGFGIVFHVKHKKDANEYAVKRINMAVQTSEGIERELKIKDCDHENIIKYFDSWTEHPPQSWQEDDDRKWMEGIGLRNLIPMALPYYGGYNEPIKSQEAPHHPVESRPKYFYIRMELCDKDNLADWLLKNNMDQRKNKISPIFEQIVAAVNYIHRKGLIHRDLKPENIFFGRDDRIKVADFGVITEHERRKHHNKCQQSVSHSEGVGTEWYKAPEIDTPKYDHKVDIYSLGIILYELITPFSTESERFHEIEKLRTTPFPKDFDASLHQFELIELMKKMLSKNPKKRPTIEMVKFNLTGWFTREDSHDQFFDTLFTIISHVLEHPFGNSLSAMSNHRQKVPKKSDRKEKIVRKDSHQRPKKDHHLLQ